ncbi:MAG: DNA polymerase III subunit delta [Anaerolineales bacterium]|nr:DNA polymerase III subunit delta [Anaerolineales bacterium]
MSTTSPTIYLLHGNDEFAIHSFLEEQLKPKMGDSSEAAMDITTLDGNSSKLDGIKSEVLTIPFLSKRRMVVVNNPLVLAKSKTNQEKFISLLESIPSTTALILIENEIPKSGQWLVKWIQEHKDLGWGRVFSLITGGAMTRWIQDQAEKLGGKIHNEAAQLLASYIAEDPRLAKKEIEKLLTYVDFSRPISEADVRILTADVRQGDIFEMVDAIGNGDGKTAMFMLRRLLEGSDPLSLFGMIVRQFRLMIQVRELLDEDPSQDHNSIADKMNIHPYPIKKIIPKVNQFTLPRLKTIFHQLSEVDQAMKTGQLEFELALDLLIASLTQ